MKTDKLCINCIYYDQVGKKCENPVEIKNHSDCISSLSDELLRIQDKEYHDYLFRTDDDLLDSCDDWD